MEKLLLEVYDNVTTNFKFAEMIKINIGWF